MKTIFVALLFCGLLAGFSQAQSIQPGVAVAFVTPMGDFGDAVGTGYGGVIMVKIGLPIIDLTGSAEYLSFGEKEILNTKISCTMWSVNAGARISVFPLVSAGAEIGNYWITVTSKNASGEHDSKVSKVAITPLIAVQIAMLEASLRYALIEDSGFFSIRAGIYF